MVHIDDISGARIIIIGNSGAGKSTLAKHLKAARALAHLDLDTLAWNPTTPPSRRDLAAAQSEIDAFIAREPRWVIEGCYADLARLLFSHAQTLVYLNPDIEACVAHCRARPFEPHKYASKAEQDANLEFLIAWVRGYAQRDDVLSQRAHQALFADFPGEKVEITSV